MVVIRDVHFQEEDQWDWGQSQMNNQPHEEEQWDWGHSQRNQQPADPLLDETFNDPPIRGTRSLEDVYQRSNVALCEPEGYEEAKQSPEWQKAMQEEISMIEKNCT
jgi:hypothetical protein